MKINKEMIELCQMVEELKKAVGKLRKTVDGLQKLVEANRRAVAALTERQNLDILRKAQKATGRLKLVA